ncbi:hypothetical protein ACOSP7_007989 [Xanthoceras sorbifolium]
MTPQQSQFYDVVITGISVAGKKLPIKSGVELEVDVKEIFLPNSVEQVCFAFTAADEGDCATLGNIMQRSVQVVHDVEGGRVGFGPGTCT